MLFCRGEEEIAVQGNLRLGGRDQPCRAPFSWLIKSYYQSLWEESEFVPGEGQIKERMISSSL